MFFVFVLQINNQIYLGPKFKDIYTKYCSCLEIFKYLNIFECLQWKNILYKIMYVSKNIEMLTMKKYFKTKIRNKCMNRFVALNSDAYLLRMNIFVKLYWNNPTYLNICHTLVHALDDSVIFFLNNYNTSTGESLGQYLAVIFFWIGDPGIGE